MNEKNLTPSPAKLQGNNLSDSKLTPEQRIEFVREAFSAIKDAFIKAGGTYYEDVPKLYDQFKQGKYIVRREDPKRLLDVVLNKKDMTFTFDPTVDKHQYANCAVWETGIGSRGLLNAFQEGFADLEGMVMVEGFVEGKDSEMSEVPHSYKEFLGMDRAYVRSVKGTMHPEDLRFVVLRIPGKYMSPEAMTEQERDEVEENPKKFIFRGFTFNTEN